MKALSIFVIFLVTTISSSDAIQPEVPVAAAVSSASPAPIAATTNDTATDFSCVNRTFDTYFPDVSSGCQKFHLCSKTEGGDEVLNLSFMCPAGTAFDVRVADCQSAETVVCKAESSGSRAARKVGKTLKTKLNLVQPKTSFKCSGRKLGVYHVDLETNCSTFHLCTVGDFKTELLDFQFMCLEGTIFDEKGQQCRPEGLAACGRDVPVAVANVTVATTTAQPDQLLPEEVTPSPQGLDYDYNYTDVEYDYVDLPAPEHARERRSATPVHIGGVVSVEREKRAPPPSYDMDFLPDTSFSCVGRVPGGYYADVETGCQMYHVCTPGADGNTFQGVRFLCSNGTIFSQQTRTCQTWYTVDCDSTAQFFALNDELSRFKPDEVGGLPATDSFSSPQVPQQQVSETFADVSQQRQPAFRQQAAAPETEDSRGPPAFTGRFQQLAEAQRQQDSARVDAAPAGRRRKQRRRKPRPTTEAPPASDGFPLDLLFGGDVPSVPRRPVAAAQPQTFNIEDNVPGLLEEIQVRGRFQQTEDDFVRDVPRRQRPQAVAAPEQRVPLQRARLQQQESIQVGVPTAQRIPATSDDILAEFGSLLPAPQQTVVQATRQQTRTSQIAQQDAFQAAPQARFQAAPQPSRPVSQGQSQGQVFDGFDAFISAAIEDEHQQRAQYGAILEQRRQQQEFERQQEVQQQQQNRRKKTKKRTRTTTTTPRPQLIVSVPVQQRFFVAPQQQTSQGFVNGQTAAQIRNPSALLLSNPVFQTAPIHHVQRPQAQLFQAAAPLQQVVRHQPSFPTLTVTQPNANLDAILLQQLSHRPQPLTANPAAAIRDVLFLVPAESEQSRSVVQQEASATLPQQVQQQQAGSQLLRFDSPGSSGFELRTTRVRRSPPPPPKDFLKLTSPRWAEYPSTPFTCKGKVTGGYYADVDTGCEMFHICTSGRKKSLLYDFRFWCANATVFDQRSQTCNSPDKVSCDLSPKYYPRHPLPEEPLDIPVPDAELFKIRVKRAVRDVVAVGPNDYPPTTFRCAGKDANKYYADAETNCQLFHLCAGHSPGSRLDDYRFLCRNGTVFDQRSQACDDQTDALNCQEDPAHYGIGEIFSRTPVV